MNKVYLSLGSNLGDRLDYLTQAVIKLNDHPEILVTAISDVFQTAPYGPVEQDDFLNIALEIQTSLAPLDLLDFTQNIEQDAHRQRDIHWGPRTLDIDIIEYTGVKCQSERLTLPHPQAHKRRFVLEPLMQVWPNGKLLDKDLGHWLDSVLDQDLAIYKDDWRPLIGQQKN